ncbi:MAG: hypothetical protein KAS38_13980 [Anaerolineales bacterium]|nr:hypothetical protein [Anaerolineales bacterium]
MESNKVINITIFHTNDMHGRLQEIARLSNFARRRRDEVQAEGRRVFFWDAGDAADRRLQLCSITKGAAFSQILNAMGYSLQTMGNAISLPYGPQTMKAVVLEQISRYWRQTAAMVMDHLLTVYKSTRSFP